MLWSQWHSYHDMWIINCTLLLWIHVWWKSLLRQILPGNGIFLLPCRCSAYRCHSWSQAQEVDQGYILYRGRMVMCTWCYSFTRVRSAPRQLFHLLAMVSWRAPLHLRRHSLRPQVSRALHPKEVWHLAQLSLHISLDGPRSCNPPLLGLAQNFSHATALSMSRNR